MFVYRLESKREHRGVYKFANVDRLVDRSTRFYFDTLDKHHHDQDKFDDLFDLYIRTHPSPVYDSKIYEHIFKEDGSRWYFAFKDVEQLFNWFPPIGLKKIISFADEEIVVGIYETENYHISDHQAIFELETSKRVDELDIYEFIRMCGGNDE